MELFTVLGSKIGTPQVIPGNQPTIYPLQEIASGIYVARFTAAGKSVGLRFVVY